LRALRYLALDQLLIVACSCGATSRVLNLGLRSEAGKGVEDFRESVVIS
jgi:hypothetical protein